MELQRTRIILFISLVIVTMALFNEWQRTHAQPRVVESREVESVSVAKDIPSAGFDPAKKHSEFAALPGERKSISLDPEQVIRVETDNFRAILSKQGGDLVAVELKDFPKTLENPDKGVMLLDSSDERVYVAQTGLIGKDQAGPDSNTTGRARYSAQRSAFSMTDNESVLEVPLQWTQQGGVNVTKTYRFHRDSYLIDVSYTIENNTNSTWQGSFYGQAKREWSKSKQSGLIGAQMYQGAAVYTKDKPYKKVSFSDMKEKAFEQEIQGGWAALLERYFLCAWLPDANTTQHYYTRADGENTYKIGTISNVEVLPQSSKTIQAQWYVGPEEMDTLKEISPGLELTIDYGILWPISQLLFWGLKKIHHVVGNWGWSIILLTFLIKLAFYRLSATSYRSMGRMRQLQPKIETLKQSCGEDKQKFSQAMLELYRKEKVNPLGGCLPILIQIPVFIALYYVLLESVELRQAPFMFWIQDLSVKDPYYVLPIIMGASMLLQQRMNPAPPDPIQAKIMMLMPIVFTVLFLSFPAGLVLYWVVNNALSIVQQWFIMRSLERGRGK